MKWNKLGRIFCPDNNYDWMVSHASCPLAHHLKDDLFRIYFSTRNKNNFSYVAFIDVDIKNPFNTINISNSPCLEPGLLGSFDDAGVMPTCILKNKDSIMVYYVGWTVSSTVPFKNFIGLAISKDGTKFNRVSNSPVLDRNHEDYAACVSPFVIKNSREYDYASNYDARYSEFQFMMWYSSFKKWDNKGFNPFADIKYANSKDGYSWNRENNICIESNLNSRYFAKMHVIYEDSLYKMWYSYKNSSYRAGGKDYRIGYAESKIGIDDWMRMDEKVGIDVSKEGWDSEMIEYPCIFDHKGRRYMLYNGNGYGKSGIGIAILE